MTCIAQQRHQHRCDMTVFMVTAVIADVGHMIPPKLHQMAHAGRGILRIEVINPAGVMADGRTLRAIARIEEQRDNCAEALQIYRSILPNVEQVHR